MKTLHTITLTTTMMVVLLLSGCIANPPAPPSPPPAPPPVVVGNFTILEYDAPGRVAHVYSHVSSFKEQAFPRSVTFDYNGRLVTLTGSYQINQTK